MQKKCSLVDEPRFPISGQSGSFCKIDPPERRLKVNPKLQNKAKCWRACDARPWGPVDAVDVRLNVRTSRPARSRECSVIGFSVTLQFLPNRSCSVTDL